MKKQEKKSAFDLKLTKKRNNGRETGMRKVVHEDIEVGTKAVGS